MEVKPSREVKAGDTVFVRKLPVIYTVRVKGVLENRLPASRVKEYLEDLTSPEELEKLTLKDMTFFKRDPRTGRPTKKDRRLLDHILNSNK